MAFLTTAKQSVVRWGVIGCGQIAIDKSLPGLLAAEGVRLVAVSDPLEPRRDLALALAKQQGVQNVRACETYHALLQDVEIDAVYIALPTGMHAEAVLAAADAKKAILCEKPLGRSAAEVRMMVRAAEKAGVPLMTGYMSRFGDVYGEVRRVVADGLLGTITFVSANFSYPALAPYPPGAPGGWRWTDADSGGPLLDIGIYLAFALREWLGSPVAYVFPFQCDTVAPPGLPNHDTTVATFQTKSGVPGTFAATFSPVVLRLLDALEQFPDFKRYHTEQATHFRELGRRRPDLIRLRPFIEEGRIEFAGGADGQPFRRQPYPRPVRGPWPGWQNVAE